MFHRRYEDFTTIDWIQDSILERNRRIRHANKVYAVSHRGPHGEITLRWLWSQFRKVVDAGQTWFVVSLVGEPIQVSFLSSLINSCAGVCIGLNAGLISIVTEWLSDIKMGYCSDGWWLNQQFCCWEIENDETDVCASWHPWSDVTVARWFIYVIFAVSSPQRCHTSQLLNLFGIGHILVRCRTSCQVTGKVRCGIRDIRDQVYPRGIRHERFSWFCDLRDQKHHTGECPCLLQNIHIVGY